MRLELVRLVNETRRENGVAELTVNEALMDAAQSISDKEYSWHHTKEECGGSPDVRLSLRVRCEPDRVHRRSHGECSPTRSGELDQLPPGHFETMIDQTVTASVWA